MEEDEEHALLAQAQQRIQAEREQRGYHVVVQDLMRAEAMAGNLIPETFEVYSAETRCTEKHPHGQQCLWIDYVFHWQGHWQVVLFNDLQQPGIPMAHQAKKLLATFERQVKQWHVQQVAGLVEQRSGRPTFVEFVSPAEPVAGYVCHEEQWYKIMERVGTSVLCLKCTAREFALIQLQMRDAIEPGPNTEQPEAE